MQQIPLLARLGSVKGPAGIVYSTAPEAALAVDKRKFVIKGADDPFIVLAELIGYSLASDIKIPVPNFGVGHFPGQKEPVFASEMIEGGVSRDVSPWLRRGRVVNIEMLAEIIVLDVWMANPDRNFGNLLVTAADDAGDRVELMAIDFEKAATIRSSSPHVAIPTMNPRSFWPSEDLGRICKKIVHFGTNCSEACSSVSEHRIVGIIEASLKAMTKVFCDDDRRDSILKVLLKRQRNLCDLLKESMP